RGRGISRSVLPYWMRLKNSHESSLSFTFETRVIVYFSISEGFSLPPVFTLSLPVNTTPERSSANFLSSAAWSRGAATWPSDRVGEVFFGSSTAWETLHKIPRAMTVTDPSRGRDFMRLSLFQYRKMLNRPPADA